MRLKLLMAATAASFLATGASAQTATFGPGDASPGTGFTVINEFTTLAGLTTTGNVQIKNSSDGDGAIPANSNPGGSTYLSVLGGASATYNLGASAARSIQFDWGSIDRYNTLTVNTVGGQTYTVIPGSPTLVGNVAFPNDADGNQVADGTNGLFTFSLTDDKVSSVTFASSANSFEIDRFAVAGVPEPTTWALMIVGFGAVGGAMRRRKVATAAFA